MNLTLMESRGSYHPLKLFLAFILVSMIVNVLGGKNPTGSHEKLPGPHFLKENSIAKTFQMENGDIVDCFDIYKQPGFDHPMLEGLRAEIESMISQHLAEKEAKNSSSHSYRSGIECPARTIPVIRMKPLQKRVNSAPLLGPKVAYLAMQVSKDGQYSRFKATLSVYPVKGIELNQDSSATIWIASPYPGYEDRITAGWMVSKDETVDDRPRLNIDWRSKSKGGCYNLQCEGFLTTSETHFPGMILPNVSTVGGPQHDITLTILRDTKKPKWLLFINDEEIGFWPAKLFDSMVDRFSNVAIGGISTSLKNVRSPPMGSGLEPQEGKGKAAYISRMEVGTEQTFTPADGLFIQRAETDPQCYKVGDVITQDSQLYLYYGGPGGCTSS